MSGAIRVPVTGYCVDCGGKNELPQFVTIERSPSWMPVSFTLRVLCTRCARLRSRHNGCNGNVGRKDRVQRCKEMRKRTKM